jgi:predicted HicB family RNase H-like nuclease
MNLMKVDGYIARIEYDKETDQFRGDILGISGEADFYG